MFGDIIKKLRKDKKLSQDDVANAIGISPAALSKLENNKTLPMRATKISLAKFFHNNFEEDWLDEYLNESESPSKKEIIEETPVEEFFSLKFGGKKTTKRSKEELLRLRNLVDRKIEEMLNDND